jgi:prepilin-type N-terminal cleavage/methylation domain-containing protein
VGRRAFTAIELVVVLVLITILAVMLLPALEKGRVEAVQTKCLSQIRQVGIACTLYQGEYDGQWPWVHINVRPDHPEWPDPTGSLVVLYPAFVPQVYLFQCPSTDDAVAIDPVTREFMNCTNWYVAPNGRATRAEDEGKGAPHPPSYFYDAGSNGLPGIPRNAASSRVCYGDNCIHGVWSEDKRQCWLGRDNHVGGGYFLFDDKHVAWLPQQWEGQPGRLGRGVPSVPNPSVLLRGASGKPVSAEGDPNVFVDDTNGVDRADDAHLSGMMWVGDSWVKN